MRSSTTSSVGGASPGKSSSGLVRSGSSAMRAKSAVRPARSGEQSRLEAGLDCLAVGSPLDPVCALAGELGQRLDQLGTSVVQAYAVVRGVGGRQGPVGDLKVQQRPALLLRVVVDAVGIRQQP